MHQYSSEAYWKENNAQRSNKDADLERYSFDWNNTDSLTDLIEMTIVEMYISCMFVDYFLSTALKMRSSCNNHLI